MKHTLDRAHLLFKTLMLGTPLGLVLLLLGLLGGAANPVPSKEMETATAVMLTGSLLLGSKKDLLDS